MCTAVNYKSYNHFFGRTLDIGYSYNEQVFITPRNYELKLRHRAEPLKNHYAIIGMAAYEESFPLYYDGVNEKGLAMAGLNFPYNSTYVSQNVESKLLKIASFELIPYLLSLCDSTDRAEWLLKDIIITDDCFNKDFPPSPLHWIISDRKRSVTVEQTSEGLKVYNNPVGVLTNNPEFSYHMKNLINYTTVSPENPCFAKSEIFRSAYGFGLGTLSLPGDFSSVSRFVRACYVCNNTAPAENERLSVNRFFDIMGTVSVPYGCVKNDKGDFHYTIYTSCCNLDKVVYYYNTHDDNRIRAVRMKGYELDSDKLIIV